MAPETEDRWRDAFERRVEHIEDRMDRHEVQCGERYKALADTLAASAQGRAEIRADVQEVRSMLARYGAILLTAVIVIAFAAVFQESTIIEFVRQAARVWSHGGSAQ